MRILNEYYYAHYKKTMPKFSTCDKCQIIPLELRRSKRASIITINIFSEKFWTMHKDKTSK